MGNNPVVEQRSPEPKPESPRIPPVQQKEVLLFEWWLMKAQKGYNGRSLAVGGFTKRGQAVTIFRSAPIIRRHDHCTLETADGITLRLEGPINKTRTIDNGFPLQASNAFLLGFPITWDNFTGELSVNKPSEWRMLEHQPENTFDPSFQQKTVLLRNWWLRKVENASDGNRLAVGGFTECGKAMRLFDSSPIIKRHDAYTLETGDGITIRIEGFINKVRTLDNGFPLEACKTFLIGFPTTWTDFASGSLWDISSHSDIRLSASRVAEWSNDSLGHVPSGFPVKSENTILDNIPSTSNTSVHDSDTRLREAIRKFTALVSRCNPAHVPLGDIGSHHPAHVPLGDIGSHHPAHVPLGDIGSHHLPEKNIYDKNWDESRGANTREAHTYNHIQDGEGCAANLRDDHTGNNDFEAGHAPVDNDPENHEASYTEGAGCLAGDLHVDIPQDKSLNQEKLKFIQDAALNISMICNGHAITKGHRDEGLGTSRTNNLHNSVVGKDHQRGETARKNYEKFDECSTRRPDKERSGLTKIENHHEEEQKDVEFRAKPVIRSLRLKSLNPENGHGEFQESSQFLDKTNDMNCANLVLDGSKTCTISQLTDTLADECSSCPKLYVDAQKVAKSLAKPVRKSQRSVLLKHGNVLEEFQDCSQFHNETLIPDRLKTYAGKPNYTISKGSPLSSRSSILLPSAEVFSEENQDGHQHSINMCLGVTPNSNSTSKHGCCDDSASTACLGQALNDKKTLPSDCIVGIVELTPVNSKTATSQTAEKRMLRCCRKKKDDQTDRSRMKVELNDSGNQSSGASFEEMISFSSASYSRRKTKNDEVSTQTQQAEDNASHKMGCKTVWVSSYTDVHCSPLNRYKKNKLTILTPESLNLKRSRSGRLLIPRLDCSMRVMYEPDGSFFGTATVDGSCVGTARVVLSTSPSKGNCHYRMTKATKSMDIDQFDESNGNAISSNKCMIDLKPVPACASGVGLPYAPENWPHLGDNWAWRVGNRKAAGGHWIDRFISPPDYFPEVSGCKGRFQSKISLEKYIRKEFPRADVDAFFSSFSWKIPADYTSLAGLLFIHHKTFSSFKFDIYFFFALISVHRVSM